MSRQEILDIIAENSGTWGAENILNALEKAGWVVEWRGIPWDKDRDQDELCVCGHPYHRHFDSWDDNYPIGCKYCYRMTFVGEDE